MFALLIIPGDDIGIAILSMIETSLAILCVCFPAVKLLLNKHLPRYFGGAATQPTISINVGSSNGTDSSRKSLLQRIFSKISSRFSSRRSGSTLPFSMPWVDEHPPKLKSIVGMGSHIELEKKGSRTDTSSPSIFEVESPSIKEV